MDPFGHSREQASLFAGMGFDGLFFGRLDWRDKERRAAERELEMVWEASPDLGTQADLFTGVLWDFYGAPAGFCWDLICDDAPLMDRAAFDNNIKNRTTEFVAAARRQAAHYRTDNVMLTMGMDFNYQAATAWFINLDRLIHALEEEPGLRVMYSSPACYLAALHAAGQVWPTKQDDFFPYASDPHAYWSGYFSSRPASKFLIRQSEQLGTVLDQLGSLGPPGPPDLREAVAVAQHHDAVTGTERQHGALVRKKYSKVG